MASVTRLGHIFNTTPGSHSVTATPAVNDLIIIITAATPPLNASVLPTENQGGTYVILKRVVKNGSADEMMICARTQLVASSVSTIYTHQPGNQAVGGGGLAVFAIAGMTLAGASAVKSSGFQSNQAGGGTPACAMGATVLSSNPLIGAILNATNPAGLTPPSGWTEDPTPDIGYNNPATGIELVRRNSGETGSTITWGSTSASAFCSVAYEFDAGTPAATKRLAALGVG